MIDIKSAKGEKLLTIGLNEGAKGRFSLMSEDSITLPFKLIEPQDFGIGTYVDMRGVLDEYLGGKLSKVYYVTEKQNPAYNISTGAYEYSLKLNAYYWIWNNYIFKYTPENAGSEASWSLTAALEVHMGVFLRNLKALGITYEGQDYEVSIDDTVANKAVAITYDNTHLLDALFVMGSEEYWDCDVWVTDNVIHFGRYENGDLVSFEIGKEAETMSRSESKGTYATRIYAFGSTRNIPHDYRPIEDSLVVNGVVQKRLMLPSGTPYIDAYPGLSTSQVIEDVVVFDDVYPRRVGTLSDVSPRTDTVENEDGTETEYTYYRFKDAGIDFDEKYILDGQELQVTFQSGKLNGMTFGVIFNPDGADPAEQLWEIVGNENYGRFLPDTTIKPENGDEYVLSGFDIQLVSDTYIPAAEEELKQRAEDYVAKTRIDDGTYTVTLNSSWVHEDLIARTFEGGQRVMLINPAFFPEGRQSRIIGWELKLDIPYDSPQYTVGESAQYSRISGLEEKVDSIVYKGNQYAGNGRGIYLIRVNDATQASESNAYSALRAQRDFIRKDKSDRTPYDLTVEGYTQFGADFAEGMAGFGGRVDKYGNAWFESVSARRFLAVPELRYNRAYVSVGNEWNAAGAGVIETVAPDAPAEEGGASMTGEATLRLEDGEIGAVAVDDICMGIFHDFAAPGNNATRDYDDGRGVFEFAGFCTVYFRVTEILDTAKNSRFRYALRPVSERWSHAFHPFEQMSFAAYGNFSDKSRQVSAYRTRSYERWLKGVDTWDFSAEHVAMQVGDLSNLSVFGYVMDGYSAFMNNLYVTGTLNQLEDVALRMEIDTGGDGFLGYGETMTATCRVMRGWRDVTEEVTEWKVERDTGNAGDDEAWALKDKAKNFAGTLEIAFTPAENDLGETAGNAPAIFTFTAETGGKEEALGTLSV